MSNRFARTLVLLIIAGLLAVPVAASAHEVTSASLSCNLTYAGSPTGQSTVTILWQGSQAAPSWASQMIQISGSSGKVSVSAPNVPQGAGSTATLTWTVDGGDQDVVG
jgi:hypothetical protein